MMYLFRSFKPVFLMLTLLLQSALAFAGTGTTYNSIVFFGDSLTDNGNLYNYDFGYLPKSPPYFRGRFTNGYVWSDNVAKYFYDTYLTSSNNYALGGQTAIFHGTSDKYLPVSLTMAVNTYLVRSAWHDRTKTLYIIWIGGNDYLQHLKNDNDYPTHVDDDTNAVVASIKHNIESLIYHGGMNFIIVNLPDLAKTPTGLISEHHEELSVITTLHNQKLKETIATLQESNKAININLFDAYYLFEQLLINSGSDTMPDVHLTNKTEGCWKGEYTFSTDKRQNIEHSINEYMISHLQLFNGTKGKNFAPKKLTTAILKSPDLSETLRVTIMAENGLSLPCNNPDEYVFWDKLHPSAVVHKMFAKRMIGFISENYTPKD